MLDTCRPGGGLQVGKDGKLFVSTGDLGSSGNAQVDSHTSGKVLRANLDGTVPGDNPSGSLVWSKGYRNNAGLAYNPDTTRAGGTFYVSDVGAASGAIASDEINVVTPSGNYAWDMGSGMYGNGTNDPLVAWGTSVLVNPDSMTVLRTPKFGTAHQNALIVAAPTNTTTVRGKVREITLTGSELATLGQSKSFFDPVLEMDGTADPQCPARINAITTGGDGWLYSSNLGANPGIWRMWYDGPGAREVSTGGSPFPMTVERSGSQLVFGWENLGAIDAGRAQAVRYGAAACRGLPALRGDAADHGRHLQPRRRALHQRDGGRPGAAHRDARGARHRQPVLPDRRAERQPRGDPRRAPAAAPPGPFPERRTTATRSAMAARSAPAPATSRTRLPGRRSS